MSALDKLKQVQEILGVTPDGIAGPKTEAAWQELKALAAAEQKPSLPPLEPLGGIDERSKLTLSTLHPTAAKVATAFIAKVRASGIDVRAISGTRTYAEQDALYAKGRTAPGPKVTNAPAGHSNHNFGIAFDVGLFSLGRYVPESPLYAQIAKISKQFALSWGGDWEFSDEPHYEFKPDWAVHLSESEMLKELRHRRDIGKDAYA